MSCKVETLGFEDRWSSSGIHLWETAGPVRTSWRGGIIGWSGMGQGRALTKWKPIQASGRTEKSVEFFSVFINEDIDFITMP